jgi:ABC-type sugar transport system permease subunit
MYRTLWYAILMLGFGFAMPIGLALLLHEVPRGKVLYRTLYYLPAVTTGVIIFMLWKQFYDPSPAGFLNRIYGPSAEISRELMVLLVAGIAAGAVANFIGSLRREPDRVAWWMWPAYAFVPVAVYRRASGASAARIWYGMNIAAAVVWSAIGAFVLVKGILTSGVWVLLSAGVLASLGYLAMTQRPGARSALLLRLAGVVCAAAAVAVVTYGVRHVWPEFFKADTQDFLNDAGAVFGIPTFPAVAMVCVILPQIWAGMGPGCIIYLAAMRAIPEEMYEAADLDGAGFMSKFWTITVPFLKALIIINFVGAFIGAFRGFEPIFIMTSGGAAESTTVLGLEVWRNAYMYLKYGLAVSMAWILGSLLIGFTVVQLRILSRLEFRTASAKE